MLPVLPVPRFFEAGGTLGVLGLAIRPPSVLPQPVLPPLVTIPVPPGVPLSGPRGNFAGASDDVSRWFTQQLLSRRATRGLLSMTVVDSSSSSSGITSGQLTKWINGLPLSFSSTTAVVVGPGACRDSADAAFMQLSSAVTLDYATKDAIQGISRKTLTGTGAATTASGVVTGTSTLFKTEFGTRTGSGTIAGASTTITGTSTKFLSEVAVNDLIGTAALGFSRVLAIASDTSLTISAAIPGGNPSGNAPVIIEQPTIKVGTNTTQQVATIVSNTSLTTVANGSAIVSGQTCIAGEVALTPNYTEFLSIWLVSGGSGTGATFSTQRTTPFSLTGYTTSTRRIGTIPLSSAGLILNFTQAWTGSDRFYLFEFFNNTNGNRLQGSGSDTSWTALPGGNILAPPSAKQLYLAIFINNPPTSMNASIRQRNANSSSTTGPRPLNQRCPPGGSATATVLINCDGAQAIDYIVSANSSTFVDLAGYVESL